MCQFTEPWLAKEIAGVTDCKNKEHVFNAGIFFPSSLPDMAGKELRATAAEERRHSLLQEEALLWETLLC